MNGRAYTTRYGLHTLAQWMDEPNKKKGADWDFFFKVGYNGRLFSTLGQLGKKVHILSTSNEQNPPLSNNPFAENRYVSVFRLSTTTRNPLTTLTHHDLLSKNATTAPHAVKSSQSSPTALLLNPVSPPRQRTTVVLLQTTPDLCSSPWSTSIQPEIKLPRLQTHLHASSITTSAATSIVGLPQNEPSRLRRRRIHRSPSTTHFRLPPPLFRHRRHQPNSFAPYIVRPHETNIEQQLSLLFQLCFGWLRVGKAF